MKKHYLNFESPCIKNCKLNEITKICEGCGRTIKEIREWAIYSDKRRGIIMKRLSMQPVK